MSLIQLIKTPLAQVLERELDVSWIPNFKTPGSLGIDLRACISFPTALLPNHTLLIPTGLHLFCGSHQPNVGMLLLPRSSNPGWMLVNTVGLIDNDYQGEIMLKIHNHISNKELLIAPGERLAQAVFLSMIQPEFELVDSFSEQTERGSGGFGHTGTL